MDQQIGKVFPVRYWVGMISELDQLSFASDSDFHLLMKNKNWFLLVYLASLSLVSVKSTIWFFHNPYILIKKNFSNFHEYTMISKIGLS